MATATILLVAGGGNGGGTGFLYSGTIHLREEL
jgi:hypothetical protein